MKHKRLDRDAWFHYKAGSNPEYYQFHADLKFEGLKEPNEFHGMICLLPINLGGIQYWNFPLAGRVPIVGKGMIWLQLIPDGENHVTTVKYYPQECTLDGRKYEYSAMVWYVDMIEGIEYDNDGVAVFIDKYLDLIFTPQGDIKTDDMDELDMALKEGDITTEQYHGALCEIDLVKRHLCSSIHNTDVLCENILEYSMNRITNGENVFKSKFWK